MFPTLNLKSRFRGLVSRLTPGNDSGNPEPLTEKERAAAIFESLDVPPVPRPSAAEILAEQEVYPAIRSAFTARFGEAVLEGLDFRQLTPAQNFRIARFMHEEVAAADAGSPTRFPQLEPVPANDDVQPKSSVTETQELVAAVEAMSPDERAELEREFAAIGGEDIRTPSAGGNDDLFCAGCGRFIESCRCDNDDRKNPKHLGKSRSSQLHGRARAAAAINAQFEVFDARNLPDRRGTVESPSAIFSRQLGVEPKAEPPPRETAFPKLRGRELAEAALGSQFGVEHSGEPAPRHRPDPKRRGCDRAAEAFTRQFSGPSKG